MYQIRNFKKLKYTSQVVKVKNQVFLRTGLIISLEDIMMHFQRCMWLAHLLPRHSLLYG